MTRLQIVIVTAILFCSCGQERPKINHEAVDTTSVVDDRIKDTTKILVSKLPIKFDSTDMLLFAIGLVDLQERGGYSKIGSGSYSSSDIASSYFNSDNLIGNFINIVFQDKSGNERKLTDKKIKIRSINFLRDIFKKTKRSPPYSLKDFDDWKDLLYSALTGSFSNNCFRFARTFFQFSSECSFIFSSGIFCCITVSVVLSCDSTSA